MKENNLYLEFNDNGKAISFNLNQNIVFYGNNGKGKTRILKTIHTIYELAKKNNLANISKLIDEMNLKELKINDISHSELFITNQKFKSSELKIINNYVKIHLEQFKDLYMILENIGVNTPRIRGRDFLIYFKDFLNGNEIRTVNGFNRWINDLELIVKKLSNDHNFWRNEKTTESIIEIEAVKKLTAFLIDKYNSTTYYDSNEKIYFDTIKEKSKEIINSLSLKSAYYISTDSTNIDTIKKNIFSKIEDLNSKFNMIFWQNKIGFEQVEQFNELIYKRKELEENLEKFNTLIGNYARIKIELINSTDIIFKKDNEEIEYEKLSSGERKITFLFLSIILNDVDIYLVDEPELSLSLNYQNRIITDLHILTQNKVLIIATHAPYIYEDFIAIDDNLSKEV